MDLDLKGKKVLVTGSSRGIGLKIAHAFVEEESTVISNGRDKEILDSSIFELNGCFGIAADVSDPKQAKILVEKAVEKIGGIDILVCNVGNGSSVLPGKESYNEWQNSLAVNFFSTTNMVEASITELKKTKGSIVCISSICGHEYIPGAPLTYSVSKAALNFYIKGMSKVIGKDGIRINGVSPGNILFDGSVWDKKIREEPLIVEKILENDVSLKRLGNPDDIASLVLWLSSSKASFITGGLYVSDGGQVRSC